MMSFFLQGLNATMLRVMKKIYGVLRRNTVNYHRSRQFETVPFSSHDNMTASIRLYTVEDETIAGKIFWPRAL